MPAVEVWTLHGGVDSSSGGDEEEVQFFFSVIFSSSLRRLCWAGVVYWQVCACGFILFVAGGGFGVGFGVGGFGVGGVGRFAVQYGVVVSVGL